MRLKDRVAIVTGGAQGIGKAIAFAFAREGAGIVLSDVQEAAVRQTAAEITQTTGVLTLAVTGDVTRPTDCETLVQQALDKLTKIDILINNAGITRDNLVLRMSDDEWNSVLGVNLTGAFNCTRAVVRPMMKQRAGRIINICSVVGLMGNAGQTNYAASKGGLIALTKACAREFASRQILVNAIAPGFVKTAMTDKLSDEQRQRLTALIPLERLGEPEDVAQAALFLASDAAAYITGQVISVNGGMYM
ncbi:MAG: 3-oxoacyl-[acyl-carrier-protein] reductase [Elusimicrobia bacterium]|nr:3-oxoacyl-[acyl-carrier-protein] reductase [Elusimicrobiota bacterium]